MSTTEVSRSLRLLLEFPPQVSQAPLTEVLALVDSFVLECTSASEPELLLYQLEEELQAIHRDVVDHDSLEQTEAFLAVLRRLIPVLTSTSLISTWFELVLRPALRNPKLPATGIASAKELVIAALEKVDKKYLDKQGEFRRRMLDLYLLDAFNEGSGEDVLEWAELPEEQRERRNVWKTNLEDILVRYGLERPEDLLTQIFLCFGSPSSRLQLFNLLNRYTSQPSFETHASVLAAHPLMSSILTSLLVDNSTTACTIGLSVLTKLLPIFAVKVSENLKPMLPQLFAILARILCWRERQPTSALAPQEDEGTYSDTTQEDPDEVTRQALKGNTTLDIRPDLEWQRLELTFLSTASPAPLPHRFFTFLYYLFPCNLLSFLRGPAEYLTEKGFQSPYLVDWDDALDHDQIKTKSEVLLRQHITHPLIIWRNATTELTSPDFFARYDVPRVIAECMRLEVHNSRAEQSARITPDGCIEADGEGNAPLSSDGHGQETSQASADALAENKTTVPPFALAPNGKIKVSLQDMVNTSIALKSNVEIEVANPMPVWPYSLFSADAASPSTRSEPLPEDSSTAPSEHEDKVPSHVAQAISGLQREVLLLRNELNFELWLTRENMKQIGRWYEQRILSRNAEIERQGLHNALREYKAQVARLQRQLKDQKEQADMAKQKYADWNAELHQKLRDLREQKRSWDLETASLREAEKEVRAQLAAQGKSLAEEVNKVFQLESYIKENAHKVDRLKDYEQRIEQLTTLQKLWDVDIQKYKSQTEMVKSVLSKYKKMELRLETYEETHAQMEENARASRRQIQTLEAKLVLLNQFKHRPQLTTMDAAYIERASDLHKENARLRQENEDLRDEIEEVKEMVEILRVQVSGSPGILAEVGRHSPNIGSPLLL